MEFVILDLEWNGSYSRKAGKFINEIFEFGAVRVNESMELVDRFSMLIKPQITKKISTRVKELTHIDPEELEHTNNTYPHVVKMFTAFSKDAVIMTWGLTDIQTLIINHEYYYKDRTLNFLEKYVNLQSYCENCLEKEDPARQMGLSTAAELIGITFDDTRLHRAIDDSVLSWKCFARLYNPEKFQKFIRNVDASFYNRVCFKNTAITDIDSPLIDKKQFYALCPDCGRKGKRLTKWVSKNKSFRAVFLCESCRIRFRGKVHFKQKYEGIEVKHDSHKIEKNENDDTSENPQTENAE